MSAAQVGIDVARGLLAMSDRDGHRALGRHHVAASEDTLQPGHHLGVDLDDSVLDLNRINILHETEVSFLPQRHDEGVGTKFFGFARRLGEALVIKLHLFNGDRAAIDMLDGGKPAHHDALFFCLCDLGIMGGHFIPGAAVENDCFFSPQTFRGSGCVNRGVTTTVNNHPATQERLLTGFRARKHGHCVHNLR